MKTVLYLGIDKPSYENQEIKLVHYPIIKIIPRKNQEYETLFNQFLSFTHVIFTSKTAVNIFFEYLERFPFSKEEILQKTYIAVGKATASTLKNFGIEKSLIAQNETAEGVVELLRTLSLKNSFILWPHSALSRNILTNFFVEQNLKFESCILYDTVPFLKEPLPDLTLIDEIIFTSSSTVDAFLTFFPSFPSSAKLTAIGPITKAKLEEKCKKSFA